MDLTTAPQATSFPAARACIAALELNLATATGARRTILEATLATEVATLAHLEQLLAA